MGGIEQSLLITDKETTKRPPITIDDCIYKLRNCDVVRQGIYLVSEYRDS